MGATLSNDQPTSPHLAALEEEWRRRYGEPPPITSSAELLAQVLEAMIAEEAQR